MKTQTKFGRNYIGCVIDGSTQSADYINQETIDFAEGYGFAGIGSIPATNDEDYSQILSEAADDAASFLNEQDNLSFCSWYFEDNSLFYAPSVENARENVGFVSVQSLADARRAGIETAEDDSAYPPTDYEGEWLHISDHGNATLYVRENGQDREVWGVV